MEYLKVSTEIINQLNENRIKENFILSPVETIQGFWVLCSDILNDSQWSWAFEYLNSCEKIELTNEDFKQAGTII